MSKPSPKDLSEAAAISQSYASMILSDEADPAKTRTPRRSLAIFIFRRFDWKHPIIADLTDEQIAVLEEVEPWERPQEKAA